MRRFGKTSQNSLLRKHAGAVARASCRVGAQRHSRRLGPRTAKGSSFGGRSGDPHPAWAGRILLLQHPRLLSACLPPAAFPRTPITGITTPRAGRDMEIMKFAPLQSWGKASASVSSIMRLQRVGFKMLGEDSNILDGGRDIVQRMAEGLRERQEKRSLWNNPRFVCLLAWSSTLTHQ